MTKAKTVGGDQLRDWLASSPRNGSDLLATRVALRVLPLILALPLRERLKPQLGLTLLVLRSAFSAWAVQKYPPTIEMITASSSALNAVAAATFNSSEAWIGAAASGIASGDLSTALDALSNNSRVSQEMILESVAVDIKWLSDEKRAPLIEQPLWLEDVRGRSDFLANFPLWAREPFDAFDNSPFVATGPWGLWLAWYRAILPNVSGGIPSSYFGELADREIASKEDSFWAREPEEVMVDIADITGWDRKYLKTDAPQRSSPLSKRKQPSKKRLSNAAPESLNRSESKNSASVRRSPNEQKNPLLESVEPQSDEPTSQDQLDRRPFAQALVERMERVYEKEGRDGFAAHIHAPWGAGKTSILMMMQELMVAKDRKLVDGKVAKEWVVVSFNAWEQERRNPPWWPLVEAVKVACLRRLSGSGGGWHFFFLFLRSLLLNGYKVALQPAILQARWIGWKIKTDALPYVVLATVFAVVLWLLWLTHSSNGLVGTYYEWVLKVFTAAIAAFVSFLGASRVAVFGSANNAKFYDDISQDPMKRITRLFKMIVEKANKPICIFIDDLDRCRADYVVDLLEGIQTSFRNQNVAYVVAADRSWIKASFEMRYGSFASAVGSIGQPLGYLFLEKIFQVSTPVPGMGDRIRADYWQSLLKGPALSQQGNQRVGSMVNANLLRGVANKKFDTNVEAERASLRKNIGENITNKQAETVLKATDSPEVRAAVVLELNTSRAAATEAKHLLTQFTDIVPENPRVMKRMVNAFAMRRAIGILERNTVPIDVLARWTILEQRLPALADLLIEHPEWTQLLVSKSGSNRAKFPPLIVPFVDLELVRNIIGKATSNRLTTDYVREITRGSGA